MVKIDQLIRSKRKTVGLFIQPDGKLVVRAPLRATKAQIEEVVVRMNGWILDKQAEVRRISAERATATTRSYEEGEKFYYLGVQYSLKLVDRQKEALRLDGSFLLARSMQWNASEVFETWYRSQAREVIEQRTAFYSQKHGLVYNQLRIKDTRTRWGSCSMKRNLNFNFRLIMAPLEVIDYVIVHELVHLVHHNHSRLFWDAVQAILPDYQVRRLWLKKNGPNFFITSAIDI